MAVEYGREAVRELRGFQAREVWVVRVYFLARRDLNAGPAEPAVRQYRGPAVRDPVVIRE